MTPRQRELRRARDRRYRERHRAKRREHDRLYAQQNKATRSCISAAYRARKRGQQPPLSAEQLAEIKAIYKRARELTDVTGIPHHVDHIYPLKHKLFCGLHTPANLQVIPAILNVTKRNDIALDMLVRVYVDSGSHDD